MEKEETKVVPPTAEDKVEKEKEIPDVDLGLTEEDVKKVKKEVETKVKERHVLNKEQQKYMNEIFKAAEMPVKIKDDDFELGMNELDIRSLSASNRTQMFFRTLVTLNISARECMTTLIDVTRLLMIIADKLGVPDIVKATDDIIEKVDKQTKFKEKLKNKKKSKSKDVDTAAKA